MEPNEVRDMVTKYEVLVEEIRKMKTAVERSLRSDARINLRILIDQQVTGEYPIEFNLELGQALYQAKLDELKSELEEIKRRIDLWK